MRRYIERSYAQIGLVLGFVVLPFILCGLAKAESLSADKLNETEIQNVKKAITELKSPASRTALAHRILALYSFRVQFAPNGYEKEKKFQEEFGAVYGSFMAGLYRVDIDKARDNFSSELIKRLTDVYHQKNKDSFLKFVNNIRTNIKGFYGERTPEDWLRWTLQFMILLHEIDSKMWDRAVGSTGVFPFC